MKKLTTLFVVAFAANVLMGAGLLHSTGSDGKAIYNQYKCSKCHAIQSEGIARAGSEKPEGGKEPPDLSGAGVKHDAGWISKWLLKETENSNGKKHVKKFGGSDDELKTLANWLATLKKPAK
jgi:mono/diheme cytochrome c family protein